MKRRDKSADAGRRLWQRYEERMAEDPMRRQRDCRFLEKTASMCGVLIITFGLLEMLRLSHDQTLLIFILALGTAMNAVCIVYAFLREKYLWIWAFASMAAICLAGMIYLTVF